MWKDSWDAFSHRDGAIAKPPLAPIDAQALAFDACLDGAAFLERRRIDQRRPVMLRAAAARVRGLVLEDFLIRDGVYLIPALGIHWSGPGGTRRPIAACGSNMGHLLVSALLEPAELTELREAIIRRLFRGDFLCGAGIRTLASGERRYRPSAHHNGSSWPWDTTMTALGLRRHGYHWLARDLMRRVLVVCRAARSFPEFARGDSDSRIRFNQRIIDIVGSYGRRNRIEQPAQAIQALTVGSVLAIKACRRRRSGSAAFPVGVAGAREAALEAELGVRRDH